MPTLPITLTTRDYDFVTPLATGDAAVDGLDLTILRTFDALQGVAADPAVHGGEASFGRYFLPAGVYGSLARLLARLPAGTGA